MSRDTSKEMQDIMEILDDFLEEKQARELVARLEQEVADKSDDKHLKNRLKALREFYERRPISREHFKQVFLYSVIIFHFFVIFVIITAFFLLPFIYPLWVWMPINSFILTVTFTREVCPLTRLENYLRTSLSMPRIGGFIGHNLVKPVRSLIKTYRFGLVAQESSNDRNTDNTRNEEEGVA